MAMLWLPISASAYDFEVDGIAYKILSATSLDCEVACVIDPTQTDVTIPETVEYRNKEFKVVQIGVGSFLNSQVEAISLPESIKTIESSAFEGSKINDIELPKQLTNIKDRAFFNSYLKSLRLDFTSQCEIGRNAFSDCDSLRTVCIGANVLLHKHNFNYDGDRMYGVFKGNANLLKVDIEGTIKILPAYTFQDCPSLQSINILGTVDDLEGFAWTEALDTLNVAGHVNNLGTLPFGHNDATIPCRTLRIMGSVTNCNGPFTNSLTHADLNGEIDYLGGFIGCSMIEEVIMPNTITSIEGFKNCSSLKSVVLSESISSLEDKMFEGCINLRNLTIPSNVRTIKTGWPWSGIAGSGDLVVWELTSLTISQNSENNLISFENRGSGTGCRLNWLCPNLKKLILEKDIYDSNAEQSKLRYNVIEDFDSLAELELANITKPINFGDLPSLEKIFLKDTVPPTINKSSFSNDQIMDMELWIPYGYKDIYMSSDWNFFWNIEEFIIPIIALDFETDEIAIDINESKMIHPIITPSYASIKNLNWNSSQPSIVNVSEDGVITSSSREGEAIITATTCDGTNISASIKIIVQEGAGKADAFADDKLDICVENGKLHIRGKTDKDIVSIYNVQGQLILSTNDSEIELSTKGIYIIKVGSVSKKLTI